MTNGAANYRRGNGCLGLRRNIDISDGALIRGRKS